MADEWVTPAQAQRDGNGRLVPGQLIADDAHDPEWQAQVMRARNVWARREAKRVMRARLAVGAPLATVSTGWRPVPREHRASSTSSGSRDGPDDDSDPAAGPPWPPCGSSGEVRP